MAQIKNGDFVELDYTGRTKDENVVFDTTVEKEAMENGLYSEGAAYGPVVICVGEKFIVPGIDKNLVGKEPGNEYVFELSPDDAFGRKNAALLQLVPTARFRKENIMPVPGMQVNIDNSIGIVKTVSGGRTLVDFNHPLSGKNVSYRVKVNRIVEDDAEKVRTLMKIQLGAGDANVTIRDGNAEVVFGHDMPKEIADVLEKKVMQLVPSVKSVSFVKEKSSSAKDSIKGVESGQEDAEKNDIENDIEGVEEKAEKAEGKEGIEEEAGYGENGDAGKESGEGDAAEEEQAGKGAHSHQAH
jgi:FKBP-type peptidyl-prolyl cis-trans isomerase 2